MEESFIPEWVLTEDGYALGSLEYPYPQHSSNTQQFLPSFVPPVPLITQQPHHFQNTNPPRPTLLPAQPIPNPNNKPTQALNSIELQTLPSYVISTVPISTVPIHEIQLRSGRVVNDRPKSSVIIREENDKEDSSEVMNDAIL